MSYLVGKHYQTKGSVALELNRDEDISEFFKEMTYDHIEEGIQVLFVGDFSVYKEYEPVTYVDSKAEFEYKVKEIKRYAAAPLVNQ